MRQASVLCETCNISFSQQLDCALQPKASADSGISTQLLFCKNATKNPTVSCRYLNPFDPINFIVTDKQYTVVIQNKSFVSISDNYICDLYLNDRN